VFEALGHGELGRCGQPEKSSTATRVALSHPPSQCAQRYRLIPPRPSAHCPCASGRVCSRSRLLAHHHPAGRRRLLARRSRAPPYSIFIVVVAAAEPASTRATLLPPGKRSRSQAQQARPSWGSLISPRREPGRCHRTHHCAVRKC
jgi:hypothetical protein